MTHKEERQGQGKGPLDHMLRDLQKMLDAFKAGEELTLLDGREREREGGGRGERERKREIGRES